MAIGLMLAVCIVCAHVFASYTAPKKEQVKTEQQSDTSSEYFSTPTLSPPSVFHVHLTIDSFCLFDISFDAIDDVSETVEPIEPPKLLLTLFRVIIAPNAP